MGFRLGTDMPKYEPGETDAWLVWTKSFLEGKWVPNICYSSPGNPPHVDSGTTAYEKKQIIPTEHRGKSLKELEEIYPAPLYVSSLDAL